MHGLNQNNLESTWMSAGEALQLFWENIARKIL